MNARFLFSTLILIPSLLTLAGCSNSTDTAPEVATATSGADGDTAQPTADSPDPKSESSGSMQKLPTATRQKPAIRHRRRTPT